MILTNCAACAAPLAHNAPRCVRCWTRYCDSTCQHDHWRRGHKQMCKKIHRGGNAEQYNANKKYKEAVAAAVEVCAKDTKGQTCYICTQALHWKTKEGLVRMCSCRGTAGFAHVSCLAEQAKILVAEGEENNLDGERWSSRWRQWHACSLCEQGYHGVVYCALGWAAWKTYLGRPEGHRVRSSAMGLLGNGLFAADKYEAALSVYETQLSMERRLGASAHGLLVVQNNLGNTYQALGQHKEALQIKRDLYSGFSKLLGEEHRHTLAMAGNLAISLFLVGNFEEGKSLLRKNIPVARRILGDNAEFTLTMRFNYARALYDDPNATLGDLRESVERFEKTERMAQRALGSAHPEVVNARKTLQSARAVLAARETPTPADAS